MFVVQQIAHSLKLLTEVYGPLVFCSCVKCLTNHGEISSSPLHNVALFFVKI